jgi:hypothetical protein
MMASHSGLASATLLHHEPRAEQAKSALRASSGQSRVNVSFDPKYHYTPPHDPQNENKTGGSIFGRMVDVIRRHFRTNV